MDLGQRDEFVKMPWDDNSIISNADDGRQYNRWDLIKKKLSSNLNSIDLLKDAISSYSVYFNADGDQRSFDLQFGTLQAAIESLDPSMRNEFFRENGVLHSIQNLVLTSPNVCPQIPWLHSGTQKSVKLHQMQIACILANAFFSTFPWREKNQPYINFRRLMETTAGKRGPAKVEKVKCILRYFWRIYEKQPCGYITFHRRCIREADVPRWDRIATPLTELNIKANGFIEDEVNHLQMDFANRVIGGGVLDTGCVQEEIRFTICPELISARLFAEPMISNEAIIIIGAERYCNYAGYADTFRFMGDYSDESPVDDDGRRSTLILAVDALRFPRPSEQYGEGQMLRELKKLYAGVKPMRNNLNPRPMATGNWGCGAYRGDPHFKSLLQLMAASEAGRKVTYFTFGNNDLAEELTKMYTLLNQQRINVGRLYRILRKFASSHKSGQTVFQFVTETLNPSGTGSLSCMHDVGGVESGFKRTSNSPTFRGKISRKDDKMSVASRHWLEKEKTAADQRTKSSSNSRDLLRTASDNDGNVPTSLFYGTGNSEMDLSQFFNSSEPDWDHTNGQKHSINQTNETFSDLNCAHHKTVNKTTSTQRTVSPDIFETSVENMHLSGDQNMTESSNPIDCELMNDNLSTTVESSAKKKLFQTKLDSFFK